MIVVKALMGLVLMLPLALVVIALALTRYAVQIYGDACMAVLERIEEWIYG